jgi:hypothetical protein
MIRYRDKKVVGVFVRFRAHFIQYNYSDTTGLSNGNRWIEFYNLNLDINDKNKYVKESKTSSTLEV